MKDGCSENAGGACLPGWARQEMDGTSVEMASERAVQIADVVLYVVVTQQPNILGL